MFLSAGCSLLRAEDFSCSLCDLYVDLKIGKLQFFDPKNIRKSFTAVNFFRFVVIKTLDSKLDPDPH